MAEVLSGCCPVILRRQLTFLKGRANYLSFTLKLFTLSNDRMTLDFDI
jgi:hypothetical protein